VVLAILFFTVVANTSVWRTVLGWLFPGRRSVVHPRSLLLLVGEHLKLVGISSGLAVLVGVPLGIWVTRPSGRDFLPLVNDLTSFGQTFPPVAVLALAVPSLGFGLEPTVVALFLYGLLPIVRNTTAGLQSVPEDVLQAARGMGMGRLQRLMKVELPLALNVIVAGVRISVIINIGTAMIGAVIGAGGLGSPIIAGLVQNNMAYVIEGAVPAALLAILADQLLSNLEHALAPSPAGEATPA
jgi:osmoprotectant transport system permease protein